jgi:hypothetical protein
VQLHLQPRLLPVQLRHHMLAQWKTGGASHCIHPKVLWNETTKEATTVSLPSSHAQVLFEQVRQIDGLQHG